MVNDLTKLYNTMSLIETKGEGTKLMATCLQYLEGLIAREQQQEMTKDEPVEASEEE